MMQDASGNVYTCNANSNVISKYSSSGSLISASFASGMNICAGFSFVSFSSGSNLSGPRMHVWTASNILLVADSGNHNVWSFDLTGGVGLLFCTTSPAGDPLGITIDPSNGDVYIGSYGTGNNNNV